MGVCFSKKKEPPTTIQAPQIPTPDDQIKMMKKKKKQSKNNVEAVATIKEEPKQVVLKCPRQEQASATPLAEKKKAAPAALKKESNVCVEEEARTSTVRTSNCTKEELDAILIQCGRLSRSSSGKASSDNAAAAGSKLKRCSGSKRSYDFDNDLNVGRDNEEQQIARPSPRRRTPNRERSGSRERESQRRGSRSPGRRSDGCCENKLRNQHQQQQPAKMVSVPAREKGVPASNCRSTSAAVVNKRNASPRSRSPANTARVLNEIAVTVHHQQPQALSRSNSRKGEQSPCRRNPMTEIDTNRTQKSSSSQLIQTQKNEAAKGVKEIESVDPRTTARNQSWRRSSRDLDHLLEDIQHYQQQNAGFSLPACVSKACSILEAVADLNSSSSEQTNNVCHGRFGRKDSLVESEIVVKDGNDDDLLKPSLQKYVTVKDMEPQESAGSNSFVGQSWQSDVNSIDSSERHWTSQSKNEEVEESSNDGPRRGMRFTSGGSSSSGLQPNSKRRDNSLRKVPRGGRAYSVPVAATTT